MPESSDSRKTRVTLEQLLRLKRSERPDPSFWDEFDRGFQQRRLAALVAVTPWYARAARVAMVVLRRTAPVGAAGAALAAGFLALNHGRQEVKSALQLADVDAEVRYTLLPEERVSPAVSLVATGQPAQAESPYLPARYAVNEIGFSAPPTRSFVTMASPQTFTFSSEEARGHMHTLTARPTAQPVAASF